MTTTLLINGAHGKMGTVTVAAINASPQYQLVASIGRGDNLDHSIKQFKPDIVIDFTLASCAFDNAKTIIDNHTRAVIGTSGLLMPQIDTLTKLCRQKNLGCMVVPNFSLGAILMMRYAADAAKYFKQAQIIETHNPKKQDKPSGTARKTEQLMHAANKDLDVLIESRRIDGVFANQQVVFNAGGESLSIDHQCHSREAMMPGVLMACDKVMHLDHLEYGLHL